MIFNVCLTILWIPGVTGLQETFGKSLILVLALKVDIWSEKYTPDFLQQLLAEVVVRKCFVKKAVPKNFIKFIENTCAGIFFK